MTRPAYRVVKSSRSNGHRNSTTSNAPRFTTVEDCNQWLADKRNALSDSNCETTLQLDDVLAPAPGANMLCVYWDLTTDIYRIERIDYA